MPQTLQLILVLLGAAVVVVVICRLVRLPPILGYLLVGMVVGLSGAYESEWSLLSMYLVFIAVVTFRARGLFGRKSVLDA